MNVEEGRMDGLEDEVLARINLDPLLRDSDF